MMGLSWFGVVSMTSCLLAGGLAAALGLHHEPEHRVVGMSAGIIAQCGADFLGHLVEMRDELVNRELGKVGVSGQRFVGVVHVGRVVLVVVDAHRLGVDVRFQGLVGIGQVGQFVGSGRRLVGGREGSGGQKQDGKRAKQVHHGIGPRLAGGGKFSRDPVDLRGRSIRLAPRDS